ncbi:HDOD domain-containing protein [Aestuariibacter salexigens]|uniref:HDOD domain-containing protein n=1 Tax=Aestuariibacter salexigens TaxID=226010 RepID=UPI00040B4843|nr:HDOD domain-containing protein [Aestuariibacter salexigens]
MNAIDYASKAGELFVLPDAVVRIKQLIEDDSTSMADIAEIINFDPSLASQLLRTANSALYKFPSKIDTISKAVQVIGTNSVYDLVVAYGVANAFNTVPPDVIDLDKFWEQSVSCGLLAKYFAEQLGVREPERLFVCGLLHNIGELVMVKLDKDIAVKCSKLTETDTPLKLQQRHLGFPYSDIAAELIHAWSIPEEIAHPIARLHTSIHRAQSLDDKIVQLSYVLALDNIHQDVYRSFNNLDDNLYRRLNMSMDDVESALDYTNLQSMSVLALFNPSSFVVF